MFEVFKNHYFIRNELARYIILAVWLIVNIVAFIATYFSYRNSLDYFYLRKMVQEGVSVSRASAMCININCLLILLPVCRNLISYLRTCLCFNVTLKRGLFDKNITYHRYIGYAIIFFSIIHTLGHIHNFESFVIAYDTFKAKNDTEAALLSTLSLLSNPYINPVRQANSNTIGEAFKLAAGITGIVMCTALAVIISTASEYMRRSFYNLFWYMHHLMGSLFIVGLCVHGIQGIVRKQTNTEKNNPQQCYLKYLEWGKNKECDVPVFAGSSPASWIWILIPLVIYLVERLTRFIRGFKSHKILNVILHPSNVLELQIERDIKYTAGQYLYLNYPQISRIEWHPFTITSAPDDPYVSVHIRSAGDWTGELVKKAKEPRDSNLQSIHIDGPYGSCAEDVFDYNKLVLIGAGIGSTPYASILKHICHMLKHNNNNITSTLQKVYFFWICPSIDTFEWFGEMLKNLENEMNSRQLQGFLEYKIYLTKGWSLREAKQIAVNETDLFDLFTGLRQKTNYGRPNFDLFFKELSEQLGSTGKEKIGVFYCGPKELSSELHKLCNMYSNDNTRFIYNKENF